ncbi:MAG: hypothetical protein ACM3IL_01720 [Deltaproteobacteria bacterium]
MRYKGWIIGCLYMLISVISLIALFGCETEEWEEGEHRGGHFEEWR